MYYSIIIPIFNRPGELRELLVSLTKQTYKNFEVLVIEDGSTNRSDGVVADFADRLAIRYFFKENSGQGFTRNYGFERAKGDYFVIFDSDALVPPHYFSVVNQQLTSSWLDAYGGPDAAHPDFTPIQKAISYSMTSPFTTGGIRGSKKNLGGTYHPRSFNMGLSRTVWETIGGYKLSRMGEDIEFAIRIIENGYCTGLIPDAFIYHKRRTNFGQFFRQLRFFGRARINISRYYPSELKLVHAFPALFTLFVYSLPIWAFISSFLFSLAMGILVLFSVLIFVDASRKEKSLAVGLLSVVAAFVQLIGYGTGFLSEGWKRLKEPKGFRETGATLEYPS
ncbi:glycosyltransferase [Spirosoma fluviale]|uniref:Glycosyltransferase, catalytic subunit of cellulose synthase and poly-beta-1,6-N-acetylglucosamine synthase n=1 Tax=Spirosoma fluviale TaxID=1597977 RepID=A0A286FFG2_9BACT|nr:glycosyltransferase [Spirosoma fluviale]SOD81987.1 Glycosyltransferase, catalytic subunit of cellulose synthase and poly-beta-1,6-N-acetylglucosamine synthase [Spirosoma fluviale]